MSILVDFGSWSKLCPELGVSTWKMTQIPYQPQQYFSGAYNDHFSGLSDFTRFCPFSEVFGDFGSLWFKTPFYVIFRVQQGGPLPKWPATPDFSLFEI